jgi:Kef-type K+ transport system membrane component KefB
VLLLAGIGLGPSVFLNTVIERTWLVAGIVWGLIVSKFLAAYLTQRIYGYSANEGRLIWSLSLPQVAATLAAAIVAYQTKNATGERLIDEPVINTVLVLVVVTSILGPVLTDSFGRQLLAGRESPAARPPAPKPSANAANAT